MNHELSLRGLWLMNYSFVVCCGMSAIAWKFVVCFFRVSFCPLERERESAQIFLVVLEEGVGSSGAKILGSYKSPSECAGKQSQLLWEISQVLLTIEPYLQPHSETFLGLSKPTQTYLMICIRLNHVNTR